MKRAAVLLCALLDCAAQAEIYKWVDADGKIQYGDQPPKDAKTSKVSGGVTVVPAVTLPRAVSAVSTTGEGTADGACGWPPRPTVWRSSNTAAAPSNTVPAMRRTFASRRWRARMPVRAAKG